jgi:hypothetical protein
MASVWIYRIDWDELKMEIEQQVRIERVQVREGWWPRLGM